MKNVFLCSLCHHGILGGYLVLDKDSITYKTNKLTVIEQLRNLRMPLNEIEKITWKWIVFPVATFHMINNEKVEIIIFNSRRFNKRYQQYTQS